MAQLKVKRRKCVRRTQFVLMARTLAMLTDSPLTA
jgi:hypothetical protein